MYTPSPALAFFQLSQVDDRLMEHMALAKLVQVVGVGGEHIQMLLHEPVFCIPGLLFFLLMEALDKLSYALLRLMQDVQ